MIFVIAAFALVVGFIVGGAWPKSEVPEPESEKPKTKIDVLA